MSFNYLDIIGNNIKYDLWYIDSIINDIQVVETHPGRGTTLLLLSKLHNHAILSCGGHGEMVVYSDFSG